MPRRPGRQGRQGLVWTLVVLVALTAGLDLLRGRDSALRQWWSALHVTPAESLRQQADEFRARARGR